MMARTSIMTLRRTSLVSTVSNLDGRRVLNFFFHEMVVVPYIVVVSESQDETPLPSVILELTTRSR